MGDWNAKVGHEQRNGTTERLALGVRNKQGARIVAFAA